MQDRIRCFNGPTGPVNVNLSSDHLDPDGERPSLEVSFRLNQLASIDKDYTRWDPNYIDECIGDIIEDEIVFSPTFFFDNGRKVHDEIVKKINERIPLAASFFASLAPLGLLDFINQQPPQRRRPYKERLDKIVAVFAACSYGCDELDEMPVEAVKYMISFFRSENGLRWKKDIWGSSEIGFQCLRNLIICLSKYYNDDELLKQAVNHRVSAGQNKPTWKTIENSNDLICVDLVSTFQATLPNSNKKPNQTRQDIMHMVGWLSSLSDGSSVRDLMVSKRQPQSFPEYLKALNGRITPSLLACIRRVQSLSEVLHDKYATDDESHPLWPLVTKEDVNWAVDQAQSTNFKPTSARSKPMPEKYFALLKEILDEGERGWPGRCGHFDVNIKYENGAVERVYCPVLPTLYSLMIRLPLRRGQVRRFDSGEGDMRRFNGETMSWEHNTSIPAGYWSKNSVDKHDRGYAYEFADDEEAKITGFFINTNKTGAPYHIPWQDPAIHRMLWELRVWQEKYQPIQNPTDPIDYIDSPANTPKPLLAKLPKIFALFRLPPGPPSYRVGCPPSQSECDKAWHLLMAEVERRFNEANPTRKITIVASQKKTGQPQSSLYKSHGLRVRGLSNLYQSGVPIELLSKLVAGHASILMTLYYIKYEPHKVHDMLTKAAFETQSRAAREFIESFQTWSIEEARARSVAADPSAIQNALQKEDQAQFCNVEIGMCPNDGTRCMEGGPPTRKSTGKSGDKSTYGPVPGGRRNCVLCRFFVSGPPWLVPLEIFQNALLEKIAHRYRQVNRIQREVSELVAGSAADKIARQAVQQRRDALQAELIQLQDERVEYENALFNTQLLIKMSLAAEAKSDGKSVSTALIANDRIPILHYQEVSEYEQAAYQVQASRWYGIVRDDYLEAVRNRYLDQISFAAGDIPISFRIGLTDEQRRVAHHRQAEFLATRLEREQLNSLLNSSSTLRDLELHDELEQYVRKSIAAGTMPPAFAASTNTDGERAI